MIRNHIFLILRVRRPPGLYMHYTCTTKLLGRVWASLVARTVKKMSAVQEESATQRLSLSPPMCLSIFTGLFFSCYMHSVFLHMCSVSLIPRERGGRSLKPFLKEGFAPSLSLPLLLLYSIYKRQILAIYSASVVTSILESKQEAGYKYLTWGPPISCFRKCKQESSCKCPG